MKLSGIYRINNSANGKFYVGSAVNISNRWCVHKHQLVRGSHHSKKLQRAWDKYGAEAFDIEILEVVADVNQLIASEQRWIDELGAASVGYNVLAVAGSSLGFKYSQESKEKMAAKKRGRVRSKEEREKQSASTRGVKLSPEHREKLAAINRARAKASEPERKASAELKKKTAREEAERKRVARKTLVNCLQCSTEFSVKPSYVKKGGAKYCCHPCYISHTKEKRFLYATAADREVTLPVWEGDQ